VNPTANPFPKSLPIKEDDYKEQYETSTDTKLSCDDKQGYMYVFGKDSSPEESARADQDIQRGTGRTVCKIKSDKGKMASSNNFCQCV